MSTEAAVETDKMAALATAADEARGLAMDSIAAAHSGHMGLPLGAAEIGSVLWGSQVRVERCHARVVLPTHQGDMADTIRFTILLTFRS